MLAARVIRQAERVRTPLVLSAEVLLSAFSYALAVFVVGDTRGATWSLEVLTATLGLVTLSRFVAAIGFRLYRRSFRYASISDLIAISKAAACSSITICALIWWKFPLLKIPMALFIVDWAFVQLFWGGLHFGARVFKLQQAAVRNDRKPVLIVGAGDAGMTLLKELALDPQSECRPVAVVDDDSQKWGRTIYGVPVMRGGIAKLGAVVATFAVEEILICIPSASASEMRGILRACRETAIPVRTLPSIAELVGGDVSPRDLRSPRIEDLLQREEIRVDLKATREVVAGKVVLVTGAGGSIGSELCRQIAEAGPRKLLLLDKSENSLFYVNLETAERLGVAFVKPLLVDLTNRDHVIDVVRSERPGLVFHAAAHKHVGLMELQPQEAIRNNVIGTRNIAEAAMSFRRHKVREYLH